MIAEKAGPETGVCPRGGRVWGPRASARRRSGESIRRKSTRDQLITLNSQLKYYIIIFVLLIGLGLFIWGIFLTHRVAGPLFVLQKVLENFEESGQLGARPLRKGDEFQETYQAMVECLTHIASSRPQGYGDSKPAERPPT